MNSIKENFLYNSAYQILTILVPLITTPYISRVLGADGIGVYSYSYSVAQYYVLFIMLGLNNYGNRTIASVRDNRDCLSKTFWSIYALQFILGILVTTVYSVYCFGLSKNFRAALIMGIYVISACFDINWFFFGMEKFKITVLRNSLIKVLTTVLIFLFVKEKSDVYVYCLIMVVGMFVSQIALWPYLKKMIDFYKPSLTEICIHIKPNLLLFLTVIAVSLFKIMDKIMLGLLTDTEQVGFYESAERIISIPTAFVTSLGTVMLPRMTNMLANKEEGTSKMLYKSILFSMFLSSSMCFGIMGVSKVFVPLFYGAGYEICVQLFIILLPSSLFLAFGNVIRTQYLLPNKLDNVYVISAFLGAATNLIINFALIPNYGAVGAAVGTFFAEAVVCIYQAYKVRKYIEIKKYVIDSIPFILSGLIMFLVLFNLNIAVKNQFSLLLLEIVIGVVLFFTVLSLQLLIKKCVNQYVFKRK